MFIEIVFKKPWTELHWAA